MKGTKSKSMAHETIEATVKVPHQTPNIRPEHRSRNPSSRICREIIFCQRLLHFNHLRTPIIKENSNSRTPHYRLCKLIFEPTSLTSLNATFSFKSPIDVFNYATVTNFYFASISPPVPDRALSSPCYHGRSQRNASQ